MSNLQKALAVYWVLFGGIMAIVAITDGPVMITGIAGGVLGAVLGILAGISKTAPPREDVSPLEPPHIPPTMP